MRPRVGLAGRLFTAQALVVSAGAVKANLGPEAWVRGVRNQGPRGEIEFEGKRFAGFGLPFEQPVAFDQDCREGICGSCSMMIGGVAHGPRKLTATCQLHMRSFHDGDTIVIEPWRARAFPVIKDLVVDRGAFDRIIAAGGYVSVSTGEAPEANLIPVPKDAADESFNAVIVPALSTISRDLTQIIPGRERISVNVEATRGSVIAYGRQTIGSEAALWRAVAPGQEWWLPVPPGEGIKQMIISSPEAAEIEYQVDLYGPEGFVEAHDSGVIDPRGNVTVPLAGITQEAIGVRVISTGPVVPALRVDSPEGLAWTAASPVTAPVWLLPGASAPAGGGGAEAAAGAAGAGVALPIPVCIVPCTDPGPASVTLSA